MAVRELNGTSDYVRLSIGALAAATFGTYAAIFKVDDTANTRTLFCFLDSGSNFLWLPMQVDSDDTMLWFTNSGSKTSGAIPQGVWVLLVARKATGTATPRVSYYNFTTTTWTHGNATAAIANGTAPTSGFVNTATVSDGSAEPFDGRIAVTGAWSNSLPWSADTTGDNAIVAAGLEISLANWVTAAPGALWPWNPAVAAGLVDIIGSANQVAISGTTLVNGDDPPGFSFSLGPPPEGPHNSNALHLMGPAYY